MNREEDYPASPRRLQSILFNKEEIPEIEPPSEKAHDDLGAQERGRRVTFGSRQSSFSDHEYGGPSHHSEYNDEHSHDSEQSDREKWWNRDDDDDSRASARGNENTSSRRLSNRIMSSVASSLGGSLRRSFRSDSDRSFDHREDKDKDTDKSPDIQTKRGFLTNMMSNIAPKNPPLHYCIIFTVSMLISASVMMGGALVYRSLLSRGNKTQDTRWDEGLSSYPSYAPSFHSSYAPSLYPSYAPSFHSSDAPSEKKSLTFEPSPMAPSIAEPSTNTMFSSIPTETEGCVDDDYFLFTIDNGNTQDW
jgi:hypothetical protein